MSGNENWARDLAARWLPGELFRWELYSNLLCEVLDGAKPWLDLGCGHSDFIREHAGKAGLAVGVDADRTATPPGLFAAARLEALPFADSFAGTLSLRFVLEHIEHPELLWRECRRVLAPGGRLVLITTNRCSPQVLVARLTPGRIRGRIISRLFKVSERDVFPTFHRWNTPGKLKAAPPGFELERIEYVEALDWSRRWIFRVQLLLARLTRHGWLRPLRSNILAVYRRAGGAE